MSEERKYFQTPNQVFYVEVTNEGFEFDVESGCCCSGFQTLTVIEATALRDFLTEHLQ